MGEKKELLEYLLEEGARGEALIVEGKSVRGE